jgi:hypothetical protein
MGVADPPLWDGRYHRRGGRATWYGSSSESAAWSELTKNPPEGVDPLETRRRLGRVVFDVLALDLTSEEVLAKLDLTREALTAQDRENCQLLADLAVGAGFEAIIGPSAALAGESTLAVFAPAIALRSHDLVDLGVHTPRG